TYPIPADFAGDGLGVTARLHPVIQLAEDAPAVALPDWSGSLGTVPVAPLPHYPVVDRPTPFTSALDQDHTTIEATVHVDATAQESSGCVTLTALSASDGNQPDAQVNLLNGASRVDLGQECPIHLAFGQPADLILAVSVPKQAMTRDALVDG